MIGTGIRGKRSALPLSYAPTIGTRICHTNCLNKVKRLCYYWTLTRRRDRGPDTLYMLYTLHRDVCRGRLPWCQTHLQIVLAHSFYSVLERRSRYA